MTEPIDLLDEASWLFDSDHKDYLLAYQFLIGKRTVGDLRRLLAMARDAERLREALVGIAPFTLGLDGTCCYCDENDDNHSVPCTVARAALGYAALAETPGEPE